MKILAISLTRPGHVLQVLVDWWKAQGHEVEDLRLKSSYRTQLLGKWLPRGDYDVIITAEPATLLRLRYDLPSQMRGGLTYNKLIFWRIDYRPNRYFGVGGVADFFCRKVDEVWSIVPNGSYEKYVPALLRPSEVLVRQELVEQAVWIGSDIDESTRLVQQSCLVASMPMARASWASSDTFLTEAELNEMLSKSMVGLIGYNPLDSRRKFSDPARVKRYLGAGLPIVTTRSYPFWSVVVDSGAGIAVDYNVQSMVEGIRYCRQNFEMMSAAAYKLAKDYVVSDRWVGL